MKQISQDLQNYIHKYFQPLYNSIHHSLVFSPPQKNFIHSLHDKIIKGHLAWFENRKTIEDSLPSPKPKPSNYSYIPSIFIKKIENNLHTQKHYQFKIGKRNVSITFYTSSEKHFSRKMWEHCLQKIYIWLHVAGQYASDRCSPHLNIFIYLNPDLKKMPKGSEEISRNDANTAFTTSCTQTTEIHLYREEEWYKVFIHETFHSLGMDFSTMDSSHYSNQVKELYGLNPEVSDIRLYESYSEICAEFVHTCMFTHFEMIKSGKSEKHLGDFDEKLRYNLSYEITFSIIQAIKILHHYQLHANDVCSASDSAKKNMHDKYKEGTSMFSYFIVKSVLIFHINDFIQWIATHNRNSFDFSKTDKNIKAYVEFIARHRIQRKYYDTMNMAESLFIASNYHKLSNSSGFSTLRMTMLE
jgi:hypothetical protein